MKVEAEIMEIFAAPWKINQRRYLLRAIDQSPTAAPRRLARSGQSHNQDKCP